MRAERLFGEPGRQETNRANAIFSQAITVHRVSRSFSQDPRLPYALDVLGLPPSIEVAINIAERKEQLRPRNVIKETVARFFATLEI